MLNPDTSLGYGFGTVTLVGYPRGPFPMKHGNCFSVATQETSNDAPWLRNDYVKIVNFCYENLKHLLEEGTVTWPIKIILISERHAVVNDSRIPDEYYSTRFCEVCTPLDLLPIPQRLKHLRDIDRGDREEFETFIKVKMNNRKDQE